MPSLNCLEPVNLDVIVILTVQRQDFAIRNRGFETVVFYFRSDSRSILCRRGHPVTEIETVFIPPPHFCICGYLFHEAILATLISLIFNKDVHNEPFVFNVILGIFIRSSNEG